MVLHTWNQELDHHPHLHALVPGGGPSLDGSHWIISRHPSQRRRRKPYLVDIESLGQKFRQRFLQGLRRLASSGKLRLEGDWSRLRHAEGLEAWLRERAPAAWNVYVQGPPRERSDPARVLKYLTRYMSGGPLSDGRVISDDGERVTFMARSRNKASGNRPRPFDLAGTEFLRRWTMHILPKGYTRVRSHGGYHGAKRRDYLQRCRELLGPRATTEDGDSPVEPDEALEAPSPKCPSCKIAMSCVDYEPRPSWKRIFERDIYQDPAIYSPSLHIHGSTRIPDS